MPASPTDLLRLDPARLRLPDKPALEGLEAKWMRHWDESHIYRFEATRPRDEVYSIDTPPPTVSGLLHVGHVFSFTHTDLIARFQRMNDELGGNAICVATGGLAAVIAPETQLFDHVDIDLTLQGLRIVWNRNRRPS